MAWMTMTSPRRARIASAPGACAWFSQATNCSIGSSQPSGRPSCAARKCRTGGSIAISGLAVRSSNHKLAAQHGCLCWIADGRVQ